MDYCRSGAQFQLQIIRCHQAQRYDNHYGALSNIARCLVLTSILIPLLVRRWAHIFSMPSLVTLWRKLHGSPMRLQLVLETFCLTEFKQLRRSCCKSSWGSAAIIGVMWPVLVPTA